MADDLTLEELGAIDPDEFDNPDLIKKLRSQASAGSKAREEAATARTELESARREAALLKANVDPDSRLGRIFASEFKGDVNDRAAVANAYLAFVQELGIPAPGAGEGAAAGGEAGAGTGAAGGESAEGATGASGEGTGTAERQGLASGAPAPDASNPGARDDILRRGLDALHRGARWEDAAGGVANAIANAAMAGDVKGLGRDGRRLE